MQPLASQRLAGQPHAYDRRRLSYAGSFPRSWRRVAVGAVEWATAKPAILARVREFERRGPAEGAAFWSGVLDVLGIEVLTPPEEVGRIPAQGPVVLVANHPHGLVDGLVIAELVGRVRPDWRILSRSILVGLDPEASRRLISVPFPDDADVQAKMLEMRRQSLADLGRGGLVALFPSGVVASSRTAWGPAVEAEWNAFTAKLIRVSGATVLPMRFPGSNGRAYQLAARLSPTLRQGLLLHEVVRSMDRPQRPVVGPPILPAELAPRLGDPRALMAWLRERTLAL